jgi:hypothetical protein
MIVRFADGAANPDALQGQLPDFSACESSRVEASAETSLDVHRHVHEMARFLRQILSAK